MAQVEHPNREKASSKAMKAAVVLLLLVSALLIAVITAGGWSELQGAQPVAFAYILVYLVMAWYVSRWNRGVLPVAAALAVLFGTALQSSALGAVLTFAARPLYSSHLQPATAWGVDPLTDQQLAGLVMWVPAGTLYVVAMAGVLLSWLRGSETVPAAVEGLE